MKKSVVLVLACMVSVVLLILTAGFTAGVVNEKLFMEKEKGVLQAINLAEAGLNCGIGELRNQINSRITTALQSSTDNIDASDYIDSTSKDSLDFLCDVLGYAFVNSDSDEVAKAFSSSSAAVLNTGISGNYSGKVIVRKQRDETDQPMEGYFSSGKYIFPYEFIVEATGASRGTTKTLRYLGGEFNINVVQDTFARYALFTNQNKTGESGDIVLFTPNTKFTGPVHTNGNCNFRGNPAGVFTENVTQQGQEAYFSGYGYYDEDSYGNVVPQFEKSFTRGAANINLQSSVNTNDLAKQALGTMNNPGHNGIYLPSSGSGAEVSLTGGIYIRGNSTVNMSVSSNNAVYTVAQNTTETVTREVPNTGGTNCRSVGWTYRCQNNSNCCPYIWIKQDGSQGSWTTNSCDWHSAHYECDLATGTTTVTESVPVARVKTISVDSVNNQTKVGTITTINGVSTQTNEVYGGIPNGVGKEGIIIYADGQITDLKGTVQKDSQVTVSAKNDIVIGNHIRYEQYSGSGTALTAQGYTNTLGIVSCNGNVRIAGDQIPKNTDLDIHATVMSPNGVFRVDNSNTYKGSVDGRKPQVNLLGGAITNYYGIFGYASGEGFARNFVYDQRMLGVTRPPYFPTLDTFKATSTELEADISDMALIWQEQ